MLSKSSIEQLYIIIVNLIENVGKLTSITSMQILLRFEAFGFYNNMFKLLPIFVHLFVSSI